MKSTLHKNYKTASNLIIATLILDPIEFFYSKYLGMTKDEIVFEGLGILFIALTAYAIRKGVTWVKYILLVFTLLGILAIAMSVGKVNVVSVSITVLQVMLMAWALVLLFKIPGPTEQDALDSDI
ncbi:MAG: hypothetical protein K0R51_134 [Cytophagaceae bacterium]|jgi:hypothetical protein|nr:hypothetical protein [Cytophagaceae bacterium]